MVVTTRETKNMRYFLEKFEETYDSKENPFGSFPDYENYERTGTHIGADFRVVVGTPIFAPATGEMFKTKDDGHKGKVGIYIFEHKGITWGLELCHLNELPKKGKYEEGKIIAYSGNSGAKTTGPHVHAVLHLNAWVTKNYGELYVERREGFLRLEKEGRIVNCYEWFCANVNEEEKEEEPKHEPKPKIKAPAPEIKDSDTPITRKSSETNGILEMIKRLLDKFINRTG